MSEAEEESKERARLQSLVSEKQRRDAEIADGAVADQARQTVAFEETAKLVAKTLRLMGTPANTVQLRPVFATQGEQRAIYDRFSEATGIRKLLHLRKIPSAVIYEFPNQYRPPDLSGPYFVAEDGQLYSQDSTAGSPFVHWRLDQTKYERGYEVYTSSPRDFWTTTGLLGQAFRRFLAAYEVNLTQLPDLKA
jgi:hypothetical protein